MPWGYSSVGRASGPQPEGPGFESPFLHVGTGILAGGTPCQGRLHLAGGAILVGRASSRCSVAKRGP